VHDQRVRDIGVGAHLHHGPRIGGQRASNLDPLLLVAGGPQLDRRVGAILEALGSGPFIFNLGHGILPETPIEHVTRLVNLVKAGSA